MTKQTIAYSLFDPTGNITLLAETPVPAPVQPQIAQKLMAAEPGAEQVGFVTPGGDGAIRLRMAGGEFCGNASLCAAALYLRRTGRSEGNVTVRVEGTAEPVSVAVSALSGDAWKGAVAMPRPLSVGTEEFPGGSRLPVVRFAGIAHVLLEDAMSPEAAEALAPDWCRSLGAEALGLLFLSREQNTLRPLVFVSAAGTLCWETSCASGTAAVGAWLAAEAGRPVSLSLAQPGGTLEIAADPSGALRLTGTARFMRRGAVGVEL